jgi:hypothetical protein
MHFESLLWATSLIFNLCCSQERRFKGSSAVQILNFAWLMPLLKEHYLENFVLHEQLVRLTIY